jgi:hypothetical protein
MDRRSGFDRFESHYGKGNVFMDIDSIPFGLDFREHIRETLDRCDVMVALVGPNWVGRDETGEHILNETDWVRIEIEAALNKKIPLIPLLIDGARMPKPDELPDPLKNFVFRQSAAIDRDNFRSQMDRVIASIDQHLAKLQHTRPIEESAPPLKESKKPATVPIKPFPETRQQKAQDACEARAEKEKAQANDKQGRNNPTVGSFLIAFVGFPLAVLIIIAILSLVHQ